jgi:hypothetical protein
MSNPKCCPRCGAARGAFSFISGSADVIPLWSRHPKLPKHFPLCDAVSSSCTRAHGPARA